MSFSNSFWCGRVPSSDLACGLEGLELRKCIHKLSSTSMNQMRHLQKRHCHVSVPSCSALCRFHDACSKSCKTPRVPASRPPLRLHAPNDAVACALHIFCAVTSIHHPQSFPRSPLVDTTWQASRLFASRVISAPELVESRVTPSSLPRLSRDVSERPPPGSWATVKMPASSSLRCCFLCPLRIAHMRP
jgi:hypothetical protein